MMEESVKVKVKVALSKNSTIYYNLVLRLFLKITHSF